MPEIKSRKYICDICGSENDITYNRGTIQIENETHETRKCHSCGTVYRYSDKLLSLVSKQTNKSANADSLKHTGKKEDSRFGSALVLLLFGGIALVVLVGIFILINTSIPSVKEFGESAKNKAMNTFDGAPYLKLEDDKLFIDDFEYSFGIIEVNKPSGDFGKLNEKVFDLLRKQTGTYTVYIKVKSQDKYGNATEAYQRKGTINVDELRKFKNAMFWAKSGGMQSLLLN